MGHLRGHGRQSEHSIAHYKGVESRRRCMGAGRTASRGDFSRKDAEAEREEDGGGQGTRPRAVSVNGSADDGGERILAGHPAGPGMD